MGVPLHHGPVDHDIVEFEGHFSLDCERDRCGELLFVFEWKLKPAQGNPIAGNRGNDLVSLQLFDVDEALECFTQIFGLFVCICTVARVVANAAVRMSTCSTRLRAAHVQQYFERFDGVGAGVEAQYAFHERHPVKRFVIASASIVERERISPFGSY